MNGLVAAKAAGLFTVVTPSRFTAGEDFAAADSVLPSLAGLLAERSAESVGDDVLGEHRALQREEVVVGEQRSRGCGPRGSLPDRDALHVVELAEAGLEQGRLAVEAVRAEREAADPGAKPPSHSKSRSSR